MSQTITMTQQQQRQLNPRGKNTQPNKQNESNIRTLADQQQEDDTETEYCRASEVNRILDKTYVVIENLQNNYIAEKRKNIVIDKIIREKNDELRKEKTDNQLLKQELEHYKNKDLNKKINTNLESHKITKVFNIKEKYIEEKVNENLDELYAQISKQYSI